MFKLLKSLRGMDTQTQACSADQITLPGEEFNPIKRQALIAKIQAQGVAGHVVGESVFFRTLDVLSPMPVVDLESFFNGNNDRGSIGCNLDHPGPQWFYDCLREIRDHDDVQDVLVGISQIEDMWPFSDTVFVLTRASDAEVSGWFAVLQPDEVESYAGALPAAPELQPGFKTYSVWWD